MHFLNPFRKPTAEELLKEQLQESKRQLVLQTNAAAYHAKMAEYHKESIQRIKQQTEQTA